TPSRLGSWPICAAASTSPRRTGSAAARGQTLTGSAVNPTASPLHRPTPLRMQAGGLVARHVRLELPIQLPQTADLGVARPGPAAEAGQEGRAQRSSLGHPRPPYRDTQEVGLELA